MGSFKTSVKRLYKFTYENNAVLVKLISNKTAKHDAASGLYDRFTPENRKLRTNT